MTHRLVLIFALAVFMALPAVAGAQESDDVDTTDVCYVNPTASECVDVLDVVDIVDDADPAADEDLAVQPQVGSDDLAATGVGTFTLALLALALLVAGVGLVIATRLRVRQSSNA